MNTSAFGDLTLSATTVGGATPGTASANKTLASVATDGNLNESVWSLGSTASKTTIGTPNNTVTFGALWDATYLYVGIKALDSNLYNDSSLIYDDDSSISTSTPTITKAPPTTAPTGSSKSATMTAR